MTHETDRNPPKDQSGVWKSNLRDYGLLGSLLVIIALFEYLTGGVLLAPANITNLILQNSYIVIMALGMLLIIVGGNIDLSVGSIVGFIGAIAATMMVDYKMPWLPVVGLSLVAGGLIGAAQGYFVAYAKIPSFIVTLGGMLVFRGLTGNILLGQFVGPFPTRLPEHQFGLHPRLRQRAAVCDLRQRLPVRLELQMDVDADRPDRRGCPDLHQRSPLAPRPHAYDRD